MHLLRKLLADESGATAIEYGLIAALVSVVIMTTPAQPRQRARAVLSFA